MVHSATLTIRTATPPDLAALVAIDSFAHSHVERVEFLRRSLALGQCVVAAINTDVVGHAILNYTFFEFGFVQLVVVAPAHRRQGVGFRLLEALERRCSSTKLFASANSSDVAARRLFIRAGFIESGHVENLDPNDPEVVYFKPLHRAP